MLTTDKNEHTCRQKKNERKKKQSKIKQKICCKTHIVSFARVQKFHVDFV